MTDAPTPMDVIADMVFRFKNPWLVTGMNTEPERVKDIYRHDADAIRSALSAAGYVVERGWQPIETAPRDGTWLLLCGGRTSEDDHPADAGSDTQRVVSAKWDFDCWVVGHFDSAWRITYDDATHWMPLPAGPTLDDEATKAAPG